MKPKDADSFISNLPANVLGVLIYGPNEGLALERARVLSKKIVADPSDAMSVTDLTSSRLTDDPSLLYDEMVSMSLLGGKRLIRMREANDASAKIIADTMAKLDRAENFLLITAGNLGASSSLRKAFEAGDNMAALACYDMDERNLSRWARDTLKEAGISISHDALTLLCDLLSPDYGMAKQDLEKLITYAGSSKSLQEEDIYRAVGDGSSFELSAAAWAVSGGNFSALDRSLDRLFSSGESPIGILRACQRHFLRLYEVAGSGTSIGSAMEQLKPPIFWKEKDQFQSHVRKWSRSDIAKVLDRLIAAEIACKSTGLRDMTQCRNALMGITHLRAGR